MLYARVLSMPAMYAAIPRPADLIDTPTLISGLVAAW